MADNSFENSVSVEKRFQASKTTTTTTTTTTKQQQNKKKKKKKTPHISVSKDLEWIYNKTTICVFVLFSQADNPGYE